MGYPFHPHLCRRILGPSASAPPTTKCCRAGFATEHAVTGDQLATLCRVGLKKILFNQFLCINHTNQVLLFSLALLILLGAFWRVIAIIIVWRSGFTPDPNWKLLSPPNDFLFKGSPLCSMRGMTKGLKEFEIRFQTLDILENWLKMTLKSCLEPNRESVGKEAA